MIRISAVSRMVDLAFLKNAGISEVLLGCAELSRYGLIPASELSQFASEARRLGIKAVLEWDILMTQPDFEKAVTVLRQLPLDLFGAIRVQDPGAFEWVLNELPGIKTQLVLETGNHNLEAVLGWCRRGGARLERVALSSQLPADVLREWIPQIPCGVEILGLGPVLILYTPRHLLTNQLPETAAAEYLRASASSDESFHAGFRVLENRHGTFVFLGKDYCLLDLIEEIQPLNLAALRIDFRINEDAELLSKMAGLFQAEKNAGAALLLKKYPVETTRCFYKTNSTDKAFVRLKNENLTRLDEGYLGEIVESAKDSHLIIHIRARGKAIRQGQAIEVINPRGDEQILTVHTLQNLELQNVPQIEAGDFAVIPYHRDVPAKSAVYEASRNPV